jgi:hypothetical protein
LNGHFTETFWSERASAGLKIGGLMIGYSELMGREVGEKLNDYLRL